MTANKLNFDYSMLEFAINGLLENISLSTTVIAPIYLNPLCVFRLISMENSMDPWPYKLKKNKDNLILFKNRINRFKPKS